MFLHILHARYQLRHNPVDLGGVEPPTSVLSGPRFNLMSYRSIVPQKASALQAEGQGFESP